MVLGRVSYVKISLHEDLYRWMKIQENDVDGFV